MMMMMMMKKKARTKCPTNRKQSKAKMMRQVQALLSTSSPLAPQPSAPNSWLCPHSGHRLLLVLQPRTPRFLRYCQQHSRREVVIGGSSVLPLLLSTHIQSIGQAQAEDDDQNASPTTSNFAIATDQNASPATSNLATEDTPMNKKNICERMTTAKAFFDVSIDREPAGRIIVGLHGESVPIGTTRFASLVSGTAGISYRRKEFIKIMPNYIQHGGIRSYGVDADLAKMTGSNLIADELLSEWEMYNKNCNGTKNVAGSLGIIIRDPLKPPPKLKLVARKGKLEIDEEEVRTDPNGTEFVISTKDSPELDASTLVVGEVLAGMDVVEKISKVKTVQENTSSPYFRVAKLIGDKRAVVAERGFNRPYSKVVITNCGLMN